MEANVLQQLITTGPAEILIASIWQGLLLTTFAWACLKLVPGLRACTRFTVWLIVFLLVALLPCFALFRGPVNAQTFATTTPAGLSLHLNSGWAFAIEGVWLLASLLSLARLIASVSQMRSLLRNSTEVAFAELTPEMQAMLMRPGQRPVGLRLSDAIDAPSVIGFFHPAVVVPRTLWSELTASEKKHIILHEMAHLERGDDWTNLLQNLLRAFSPLNPALFWAERHLCREREQACDDAVLDAAGNARDYATCLTKLAQSRLVKRAAALAPGFWQRHSELAGRVENILNRRRTLGPWFSRGLVTASLLLSMAGALVLQRAPGIVTFASKDALAAETVEPRAGALVPVRFQNQNQAHYQDAVFHPNRTGETTVPVKPATPPAKHHARNMRSVNAPSQLQLIEMSNGEDVTLILFTVDTLQTSNTITHWIAFQI
jgi:beta-lactamase regulating signal transducer with metallopeptidase domain